MSARRPLALAATGLALALTLAACGTGDHSSMTTSGGSAASPQAGTGSEADIAFAQLMIPHHQQAVEMADLALANTSSDQVKALAAQIKAAQDPEITQMRGWLSGWGAPQQMDGATASDGSMDHSGMDMGGMSSDGMMSAEDMANLAAARGDDFDRMWLAMMIAHHQGALTMATQVLTTTSDAEVKQLAQAVVTGQTDEITTMQKLLAG
jgi:uncharacterized protein (DUF305 family)